MTRSIIDHAEPAAEGTRVAQFMEIDRKDGVHPAVQTLNQRAPEPSGTKLKEFLRIDREDSRKED